MAEKIRSLDTDHIFGEIDVEAMLRAENDRLRAALMAARARVRHELGDFDAEVDCLTMRGLLETIETALGLVEQTGDKK